MHQLMGADDLTSEGFAYCLVAKAYTQNWCSPGQAGHMADKGNKNSGFNRSAWAWREENAVGLHRLNLLDGCFIVASNNYLRTLLAQILDQVVRERIVVVEDKNHDDSQCNAQTIVKNRTVFRKPQ